MCWTSKNIVYFQPIPQNTKKKLLLFCIDNERVPFDELYKTTTNSLLTEDFKFNLVLRICELLHWTEYLCRTRMQQKFKMIYEFGKTFWLIAEILVFSIMFIFYILLTKTIVLFTTEWITHNNLYRFFVFMCRPKKFQLIFRALMERMKSIMLYTVIVCVGINDKQYVCAFKYRSFCVARESRPKKT